MAASVVEDDPSLDSKIGTSSVAVAEIVKVLFIYVYIYYLRLYLN